MRTIDVPQKDWEQALDQFSSIHEGWLVSLELLGSSLGAQPQIRQLPLIGITAEPAPADPVITIAAARANGEQITHVIHSPTHVRIERTEAGTDAALEIESGDSITAILRFQSVAPAETVDVAHARR